MALPPQRPLSGARTAIVVGAAGAAFLLVSLATNAGSSTPSRPPGWSTFSAAAVHGATGLIIALVPVLTVAGVAAWLLGTAMARRKRAELEARDPSAKWRRRRRWAVLLASVIGFELLWRFHIVHVPTMHLPGINSGGSPGTSHSLGHPGGNGGTSTTDLRIAVVLWVAMAVAAVLGVRHYRRTRVAGPIPVPVEEAAAGPAGIDYDGLGRIRDPRRGVVATYAEMERTLADRHLGRDPAEAPSEYLGRIGGHLPGSRPAASRLTRLYERAKFSAHPVDRSMHDDAIESLHTVDDDTEEPT
ncbi:MAG: DUF4129 domain-containing protein [Gaiellales bacterium]